MKMLAYGLNTNQKSMAQRVPNATFLGKVKLPKHRLMFKGVADIDHSDSDMWCVLWEIDEAGLAEIDILEGYPNFYNRKEVDVDYQGTKVKAWVYYMMDDRSISAPSKFYMDLVLEGYEQAGIGMGQLHLAQAECILMAGT